MSTFESVHPARLAGHLAAQRWFGAKDRAVAAATVADVAVLPDLDAALACAHVQFADGEHIDVQLPLAAVAGADPGAANLGEAVDALAHPAFRRRLAEAFARGESFAGRECRWSFEPLADLADLPDLPSSLADVEQSNSSIRYGDRAMIKMYRRLEPGENPDVELGRALAHAGFRGTPAILGVARLHDEGGTSVTAMLQRFVPAAVDGWSHVLQRLRAGADLTADLTALGALTRELHATLAAIDDPAFAPEPTREDDLTRWRLAAAAQARSALTTLAERQHALPAAILPEIKHALDHAGALITGLPAPRDASGLGPRTRHHGDYHLGQVLRAADGWQILDFEGEPARPLAERRMKHHPLRDVAGMLRSFAYAAAVAAPDDAGRVEQPLRAAFLAGYDPTLQTDPRRAPLLALFTAEKLFYELAYELGSRQTWAWIPLAGLGAPLV